MRGATVAADFTMYSGDSKNLQFTITDNDDTPVDLTGATSSWILAASADGSALVTKTSGAGEITYSGGSTNIATVAVDPADTASLAGRYYHELQITDTGGDVSTNAGTAIILTDNI